MSAHRPTTKSFLEDIGLGNFDEQAAFLKATEGTRFRTTSQAGDFIQLGQALGRGIGPLVSGAASGIGGLISGEGGRGIREFGRDFSRGITDARDDQIAQGMGLSGREELRTKRKMLEEIKRAEATFIDDGSFENRIKLAKEVAKIARRNNSLPTLARALEQITLLEKEEAEFRKLDASADTAVRDVQEREEIGFEARSVNDAPTVRGKAVRILKGPDAGMYLLIRPGVEDEVVRGGDLIGPNIPGAASSGRGRIFVQDTLQGLVRANGATPGQIAKMRGQMNSFAENAIIVQNISDNLLAANDPQGILAQSGKAAIASDKVISFAESASSAFTDPRLPGTRVTYGGPKKFVSPIRQHELATDRGLLNRFLRSVSGKELVNVNDFLPPALRGNAIAAEQYWANVMELAYLDARLMEPSNRGLSDNDIINALKRIGADTANPMSFATRQLEVITTKLLPQLDNLGSDFSIPTPGGPDNPRGYVEEDVVDFVYNSARRDSIRTTLEATRDRLIAVLAQGRRGENRSIVPSGDRTSGLTDSDAALSEEGLAAEIARLEEEIRLNSEQQ